MSLTKTRFKIRKVFLKKVLAGFVLLAVIGSGVLFKDTLRPEIVTAQTTNPSGTPMPNQDLDGWKLIFNDDFTTPVAVGQFPGSVYGTKWDSYPDGWKDSSKNGTYYPSKVLSVTNDGMLDAYIHTENGVHMVSAPLPNKGTGQLYGRYSVAFRSDSITGYKTAWLLWPDSEVWPRDGEIDFPEGDLDSTINGYMHKQGATSGGDQDAFSTTATYSSWHVATIEWAPNLLKLFLDGNIIGTSTSRVPNTSMHWVLQTETTLNGSVPQDTASGHVQIDWVAMWQYSPATKAPTPPPTLIPTPTTIAATPAAPVPTPTLLPGGPLPNPPTNIHPYGSIYPGSMNIIWDSVPGAASYDLRIDDSQNGWSGTCTTPNPGDVCASPSTPSYLFGFVKGHTYQIWVIAKNATYTSPSSAPITVTVTNPAACM